MTRSVLASNFSCRPGRNGRRNGRDPGAIRAPSGLRASPGPRQWPPTFSHAPCGDARHCADRTGFRLASGTGSARALRPLWRAAGDRPMQRLASWLFYRAQTRPDAAAVGGKRFAAERLCLWGERQWRNGGAACAPVSRMPARWVTELYCHPATRRWQGPDNLPAHYRPRMNSPPWSAQKSAPSWQRRVCSRFRSEEHSHDARLRSQFAAMQIA